MKFPSIHLSSASSLLGLSFDGSIMSASVMQLVNGEIIPRQKCAINLSLDPLNSAPELCGREIRTHLDEAGIKTDRCVVCIPLKWALTMQADLPELPASEENSYISLQAERGLPYPLQDLAMSASRYQFPDSPTGVCIGALPVNRLATIEKVLTSAKLRLCSITFGITSLFAQTGDSDGIILLLGENSIELAIKAGSGAAMLRSLEAADDDEFDRGSLDTDMIARQLRITLGNLSQSFRSRNAAIQLFGTPALCKNAKEELSNSIQALGLSIQSVSGDHTSLDDGAISPVAALAAAHRLQGKAPDFEFLPKHPSRIQRISSFFSGRSVMRLAAIGAAVITIIFLIFMIQYLWLSNLENKWQAMEPKVAEVQDLQKKVRDYRLWFDNTAHMVDIGRQLTSAFPEDGAVWATSIEIKGLSKVACSGMARTDGDWLKMLEKLRKTPGVKDLQVLQIRGGSPMQFSLSYMNGKVESYGK